MFPPRDMIYENVHRMIETSGEKYSNDPAMVHALVCMQFGDHASNISVTAKNDNTIEQFGIMPPEIAAIIALVGKPPVTTGNVVKFGNCSFELHEDTCKKDKQAFKNAVYRGSVSNTSYWACNELIDQYKQFAKNECVVW